MITHPKLRPVEAFPVEINQKELVALRDPASLASDTIVISPDVLFVLHYFDGLHSIEEIQQKYFEQFNEFLSEAQLNEIIQSLDARGYLDSPAFEKIYQALLQEYRMQRIRSAAHAGNSYPAEKDDLKSRLANFFSNAAQRVPLEASLDGKLIQGIVAPHIDIQAGGDSFAAAYQYFRDAEPADFYLILGTGHQGIQQFFSCSNKDFETPLGTVKTDREFLQSLQDKVDFDIFGEELLHRTEHTIEFQTIFLQYLFGDQPNWKIIPILASFSPQMVQAGALENSFIRKFLSALKLTIQEAGKRVVIIASADFAHVGPRYGDRMQPSPEFIKQLERKDLATIDLLEQLDTRQFCSNVQKDEFERRICGFPPIFSMLNMFEATQGKLLTYDSVEVDDQCSTVSFASMIFY